MISCCGVWLSGRRNWRRKRAAFEGLPSEFLEVGEADGSMKEWAFWTSEVKVNIAMSDTFHWVVGKHELGSDTMEILESLELTVALALESGLLLNVNSV